MSNEDRYTYWRRWLYETAGHREATRLVTQEARLLHVDPLSDIAIRHALATYESTTGKTPRNTATAAATQEGLIP